MPPKLKPVLWIPAAKKDLESLPEPMIREFGYALYQAQAGGHPDIAKTLSGMGGADIIELRESDAGGTYRVVYTVRFADVLVVLHTFQKKSHKGIETPKQEIDLVHARLAQARCIYEEWKGEK